MSEQTITNPIEPEVADTGVLDHELHGSDRPRRSNREVEQAFAEMFEGESQEQPGQEDSEVEDLKASGEHEEVGQEEAEASADEYDEVSEESEEQPEGHAEFYRVIVDGKEENVGLDELISGYQRQSDYTKKTTALSNEKREFEGFQQELQQERQQYANTLQQLQQQMEAYNQPNVDWELLERTDPVQWLKLREMERQREQQIEAVRQENAKMQQLLQEQQSEELQQELDRERKLMLEKIPEWSNPAVRSNEQKLVVEYARSLGFADDEVSDVRDHRALLALRDGMRYNQVTRGKAVREAKSKSKIKTANPGSRETAKRSSTRKQQVLRANLKNSGKVDDAAALFATLLDG